MAYQSLIKIEQCEAFNIPALAARVELYTSAPAEETSFKTSDQKLRSTNHKLFTEKVHFQTNIYNEMSTYVVRAMRIIITI